MKPKLFIFDMDGTLVDTEVISRRAFEEAIKLCNCEIDEPLLDSFLGSNLVAVKQKLFDRYGRDWSLVDKIIEAKREIFNNICEEEGVAVMPGVLKLLDYLKDRESKMAVATSSYKKYAIERLIKTGLIDYFSFVIAGDEIEHPKPAPDIYLKAASNFGIAPEDCMTFEDSALGIKAARDAGMFTVLIPDTMEPTAEMLDNTDVLCKRIDNIIEVLEG